MIRLRRIFFCSLYLFVSGNLSARPKAPLRSTIYDGGVISAETLGRGGTMASNRGSHASGSENPASLATGLSNSMYSTILFNPSSSIDDETINQNDPLRNKTLQYLSVGAEKGVLFYEPLSRFRDHQITDINSPDVNFRDVEYAANALGFAGVSNFGKGGQYGISLAYLWSSLTSFERKSGLPDRVRSDTFDGVRMNMGIRYPTGSAMWGLSAINAPGFLWGQRFRHETLPVRIRVGNTWRIQNGVLLSIDGERRYYDEGSNKQDFTYVGSENYVSNNLALRVGMYGQKIGRPENRHYTAGLTYTTKTKSYVSYAFEQYKLNQETVKRSVISFLVPLSDSVQ